MRAGAEPPALSAAPELPPRAVSAQLSGPALLAAGARRLQGAGLPGPGQPGALLCRLQVREAAVVGSGSSLRLLVTFVFHLASVSALYVLPLLWCCRSFIAWIDCTRMLMEKLDP